MHAPILRVLPPLIVGILLADRCMFNPLPIIIAATVLAGVALALEWTKRREGASRWSDRLQMGCIYAAVACSGFALATLRSPSEYIAIAPDNVTMSIRINEMPIQSNRSVRASATIDWIKDANGIRQAPRGTKIMLFAQKSSKSAELRYGDRLLAHCALRLPSDDRGQHQFNYRRYLKHKGILYQTYLHDEQYTLVDHSQHGFFHAIYGLRMRLIDIVQKSKLSSSQKGIAEALMLGWKNDVDPATSAQFRDAGVMHLLCVSGLHVGIVAAIIGACLFLLPANPRMRMVKGGVQLLGVWFFVLITGMAPATLRAGVMFSLIIVGQMSSSRPPTLNTIAASALILLLVRPAILFDIGFQFSYSAVAGIALFNKPLQNLIHFPVPHGNSRNKILAIASRMGVFMMRKLWGLICVSTTAQLASLPFVLYHFHRFPVYFLVANVTIVPFAGVLLATIMLMLAFAWWPALFSATGWLLQWELTATDSVTQWIAQLPHAVIDPVCFPALMALLYIAFMVLLAFAIHRRASAAVKLMMAGVAILFVANAAVIAMHHSRQQVFTVYSAGKTTAMEFIQGRNSVLLMGDGPRHLTANMLDYQTSGNLAHYGVRHRMCIRLNDLAENPHKGAPTTGTNADLATPCSPTNRWPTALSIVGNHVQFGPLLILIVDGSNGPLLRQRARSQCPKMFPTAVDYLILCDNAQVSIPELQRLYDFKNVVIASNNGLRNSSRWQQECAGLHIPCHTVARSHALTIEQ